MLKKTFTPLLAGAVLAVAAFGAAASEAYCMGQCPPRAGWTYEGCTIYMDDQDDIVDVECDYSYRAWIAE